MKKLFVLIIFTVITLASFSQNDEIGASNGKSDDIKTLMGSNKVGGYGALSIAYTNLENRDAFIFGAKGGWLMGHSVTLGLTASVFFNESAVDEVTNKDLRLAGFYGGFFFEPIIMPKFPVHVSFPVTVGAGSVTVMNEDSGTGLNDFLKSEASDAIMVIEPGMELEMNITSHFRFCIGGYYRYTTDVDMQDSEFPVPSNIMKGFSGGVTFKFGSF